MSTKTQPGNYFEDFRMGQEIIHATPRTATEGDAALYLALFGSRFPVTSSAPFAAALGLERAPSIACSRFTWCSAKPCPTSR